MDYTLTIQALIEDLQNAQSQIEGGLYDDAADSLLMSIFRCFALDAESETVSVIREVEITLLSTIHDLRKLYT